MTDTCLTCRHWGRTDIPAPTNRYWGPCAVYAISRAGHLAEREGRQVPPPPPALTPHDFGCRSHEART